MRPSLAGPWPAVRSAPFDSSYIAACKAVGTPPRSIFLAATRSYDAGLPSSVVLAVRNGSDDAWVRAQLHKRRAYHENLAGTLSIPEALANRWLAEDAASDPVIHIV